MIDFIDTHCHLDLITRFGSVEQVLSPEEIDKTGVIVRSCEGAGVRRLVNVGASIQGCENSLALAKHCSSVFAVIGIHPTEFNQADYKEKLSSLKKLFESNLKQDKLVGVGEIGLDFFHKGVNKSAQEYGLAFQIELAIRLGYPISFHLRDASEEFLKFVEPYRHQIKGASIHCFSQDLGFARVVTEWGFVLGIGGALTYPKNTRLVDAVREISLESLVLETDSPFLPVQSRRGKINYPTAVIDVAQKIAEIKGLDLEMVAKQATINAERLFGVAASSL